jgi:hypothetical protein
VLSVCERLLSSFRFGEIRSLQVVRSEVMAFGHYEDDCFGEFSAVQLL